MLAIIQDFLTRNAYFAANLFYLIPIIVGLFVLSSHQRKIVLFSGLASTPVFPLIVFLEENYWTPQRMGGSILGIEDALCSFSVAALAWLVAILPFHHRITMKTGLKTALCRYLVLGSIIVTAFFSLTAAGLLPMSALILSNLIGWMVLIIVRKDLWMVSLFGMLAFAVVHTVVMKLGLSIWSDYLAQWNTENFWGRPICGVPLGEALWAFVYGGGWPLFVSYFLEVRLEPVHSTTA